MRTFNRFIAEDDTARAASLIGRNMANKMRYRQAVEQGRGEAFLDGLEAEQAVYEKVKAVWKANYYVYQPNGPHNLTTSEGWSRANGLWVKAWKAAFPVLTEKQILRAVGENVENAFDAWDMLTDYINKKK
jgi:hypothetical protein